MIGDYRGDSRSGGLKVYLGTEGQHAVLGERLAQRRADTAAKRFAELRLAPDA